MGSWYNTKRQPLLPGPVGTPLDSIYPGYPIDTHFERALKPPVPLRCSVTLSPVSSRAASESSGHPGYSTSVCVCPGSVAPGGELVFSVPIVEHCDTQLSSINEHLLDE